MHRDAGPLHSHDALFRGVFRDPARTAELLRHLLPRRFVRAIDWTTLRPVDGTFVDDRLRQRQADLVFTVRTARRLVLVFLLLEHKFRADALTAFQVLTYAVRLWERWRATHPRSRSLPPVLPFVLYHGRRPWRVPRRLRGLIDLPRSLRTWRGAWPDFSFELADLDSTRVRSLPWHRLTAATRLPLRHLQEVSREPDTTRLLRRWREDYRRLLAQPQGQSIVNQLISYVAAVSNDDPRRLRSAYEQIHPVTEGKYMTVADKLIRKGRLKGRLEGRRTMLAAMLRERFGELPRTVLARLARATAEELDSWARAAVHAKSLARVLG